MKLKLILMLFLSLVTGCTALEVVKETLIAKSQTEELFESVDTSVRCESSPPIDLDIKPTLDQYALIADKSLGDMIAYICCLEGETNREELNFCRQN